VEVLNLGNISEISTYKKVFQVNIDHLGGYTMGYELAFNAHFILLKCHFREEFWLLAAEIKNRMK